MKTAERVQACAAGAWVRALRERLDRFDESAAGRYWRHLSTADFTNSSFAFAALAVISAFTLYISAEVWLFDKARAVGGQGLIFLLTFVLAVLFWWWSAYMLLYRRVPLMQPSPRESRPGPASPASASSPG